MSRLKIGSNKNLIQRPLINIGATLDIPTSTIVTGRKGEKIINGGLGGIVGLTGLGNQYKSTIMHYMMLTAADRVEATVPDITSMHTYDTEDNMETSLERFENLANRIFKYLPKNPIENEIWTIISKSSIDGLEWAKEYLYKHRDEKLNNKDYLVKFDAFLNKITKEPLELPMPTFMEIDSLTEFESNETIDALMKSKELKDTNMLAMKQGLFKYKFFRELPLISNKANIYFLFTLHIGEKKNVDANPMMKPTKDLQFMKQNEKIKGATDKVHFLTTHLWRAYGSKSLTNPNTKEPQYPKYEAEVETDLNIVNLLQYRSKTGPSGYNLELIVSQNEGVLPSLTEFHFIKSNNFGIEGSNRSYWLTLYPDVKLSRTTVRKKIDEDEILQRAINITSELLQLKIFKPELNDIMCTPQELYEDLKKMGYDWNILLRTRGWWAVKQYSTDIPPFLSTIDLLRMRKGEYIPYWMDKDKKVKKEYKHLF